MNEKRRLHLGVCPSAEAGGFPACGGRRYAPGKSSPYGRGALRAVKTPANVPVLTLGTPAPSAVQASPKKTSAR